MCIRDTHWFSQAEKLGNTNAAYQLGKIAFENNDIENAIKHFQYAAQGNMSLIHIQMCIRDSLCTYSMYHEDIQIRFQGGANK